MSKHISNIIKYNYLFLLINPYLFYRHKSSNKEVEGSAEAVQLGPPPKAFYIGQSTR